MTLSDWQQRFLDANNRLPPDIDPAVRSARTDSARTNSARTSSVSPRQGQAGLSAERQRYLVLPGVKGHKAYMVWDNWNSAPKLTTDNRLEAINHAAHLNTLPE